MADSKEIASPSTPLLSGYVIENILKSGLILDEDFNAILMHYTSDDKYSPEVRFTLYQKLLSAVSVAGTIFMVQHKYSISYLPIFGVPLLVVGVQHIRDAIYRRRQQHDVRVLIESFTNSLKLLRMIFGYFRFKDSMNTELVDYVNSYSSPCRKLIEVVFQEFCHFLSECIDFVKNFALRVPSLNDYLYLEGVELEQFDKSNLTSIEDCIIYLQKLCDVSVLVSSNTLTCLAIILSSNISNAYNINACEILDVMVPKMKAMSTDCYERVNKEFDHVKYYHINKKIKNAQKPSLLKLGNKLHLGTTNIMVHTSEIVDKSQQVLKRLERGNFETLREKQTLFPMIGGLRKQVNEYYESLDLFYKMLEVDINQAKLPSVLQEKSKTVAEPAKKSVNEARFIDVNLHPNEPEGDEEYELYIGANDPPAEVAGFCYEEPDRKYAQMLGQELKAKLKNHSAFAAARQKRGIVDEEPQNVVSQIDEIPPPPPPVGFGAVSKFSPPVAAPNRLSDWNDHTNSAVPPPPPPLGSFDLGPYGDIEPPPYSPFGNYLDIIKAISVSRQETEEVFEGNDHEGK